MRYLLKIAILAAIYFFAAKAGLSLAFGVKQVTLVWPPTGIAIAALLIFGKRAWPGVLIGAFLANITTSETFAIASEIAIGNTLEALTAWYLLNKFNFDKEFHHLSDIAKFMIWGAIIPTIVSATIGTAALGFGGTIGWQDFGSTWLTWWLGDTVGALIFAPLILSLKDIKLFPFNYKKILEGIALFVSTALISTFIFTNYISTTFSMYPTKYLVFPFMIWAALRFGIVGATLTTILISFISIIGFGAGGGPFVNLVGGPEIGLILLQLLMAVFAMTSIILAASLEEKRKAQKGLEASEKKFRALIENSYDAIVLVDPKGTITYASPSTKRIWGYEPEEVLGKDGFDLIYKEDIDPSKKALSKIIFSPGKNVSLQNRIIRKDGEVRWMDAVGTNLLLDPDIGAIVINFRDITEHKKLDETKSDFFSLAAHELRSPLGSIRWNTETLLKNYLKKDKISGYIDEVYSATIKMTSLVNMLLNVSKAELGTLSTNPEQIDLVLLICDAVKNHLSEIRKKDIKFTQKYADDEIQAFVDPNLVRIIIENLLSNSIKYTQNTGKVSLNVDESKGAVKITVEDNGIGIPENQKDKIFTKLFRADNVKRRYPDGTGLGLYLTKSIVDKLKGEISFESKEGKGTKFLVSLPIKEK